MDKERLKALRSKTLQGQQVQSIIDENKIKIEKRKQGKPWADQE
jgi:hypothetical protein